MGHPRKSKIPLAAGIAMAVWMVLCYFPMYFSPHYGYIRNGGLWVLLALLSFAPVALFLLFAFALAKMKPKFLLAPWGLHALFTAPFPAAACLIMEYYRSSYFLEFAVLPPWIQTLGTLLLSAGAMLCYYLAVTNRLKKNILPLLLTIAAPLWSLTIRITEMLEPNGVITRLLNPPELDFLVYRQPAIIEIGLPIAYDILGALPYILLVAGLKKTAPALKSQGEPT